MLLRSDNFADAGSRATAADLLAAEDGRNITAPRRMRELTHRDMAIHAKGGDVERLT